MFALRRHWPDVRIESTHISVVDYCGRIRALYDKKEPARAATSKMGLSTAPSSYRAGTADNLAHHRASPLEIDCSNFCAKMPSEEVEEEEGCLVLGLFSLWDHVKNALSTHL